MFIVIYNFYNFYNKWHELNSAIPDPNINDLNDVKALKEAEETIGDYKLRTDPLYMPIDDEEFSTTFKYQKLLRIREEISQVRSEFNNKVYLMRDKKDVLVNYVQVQIEELKRIHFDLPDNQRNFPKTIPKIIEDLEYPERILNVM